MTLGRKHPRLQTDSYCSQADDTELVLPSVSAETSGPRGCASTSPARQDLRRAGGRRFRPKALGLDERRRNLWLLQAIAPAIYIPTPAPPGSPRRFTSRFGPPPASWRGWSSGFAAPSIGRTARPSRRRWPDRWRRPSVSSAARWRAEGNRGRPARARAFRLSAGCRSPARRAGHRRAAARSRSGPSS